MGQLAAATALLERLTETNPVDTRAALMLAYIHAVEGNRGKALQICTGLEQIKPKGTWIANYDLALVNSGLGNQNEALSLLQESLKQREPWALYWPVDPRLHSLRAEPQFTNLTKRMVPGGV